MTSPSSSKLLVTAHRALLPTSSELKSTTLEIDVTTGKIVAVHDHLPAVQEEGATYLKVPETKILLPGLIEYVLPHFWTHIRNKYLGGPLLRLAVPMSTSTNPEGQHGRASKQAQQQPSAEESRPSLICL